MLHIKKLELLGFKSFSDKQELRFSGDGISAIVGPNGCGKSNISDAISWVLGEQSAKTLRGARMQDFIFNGARDRKPSGLAQVSMTLLDPEGRVALPGTARVNGANGATNGAPMRPIEVVVTRKLYRSGESQYLLNGKICRLRDIQDLFRGTGLGPDHYAIIEQGRIDQILSSRPLDRRAFIEEAAGITIFKNRKRLAELKLESARENLNRVNDILQEVIRQVNSLKRQASKARRYEELRGELNLKLSLLLASRYRSLEQRLKATEQDMESAGAVFRQKSASLEQLESELDSSREQQQRADQDLQARRSELSELALQLERLRSRIDQQTRLAEDNQKRTEHAETEIVDLDERVEQLREEFASCEESATEAAEKAENVRDLLGRKTSEVETARAAVRENEQLQESRRTEVLRLLGDISGLRNQLAKIEEFLAGNERQRARLSEEESAARQEMEGWIERRNDLQQQFQSSQQQITSLAEQKERTEQEIAAKKVECQTQRSEAERLQEQLSRLRARRESLDEILSHHAYTTETVKNLFGAISRQPVESFQPVGILADYVDVNPEYEKATEDFLREELEYVVVKTWAEAQEGIELLRREVQGHATFLVYPESPIAAEVPALGPETGVVGRLADAVRLTNGLSGSASTLLPRLRSCYLVEDDELGRRLSVQYPDLYFLMPDGRCYRGHTLSGGKKTSAGPLALKRELRELGPKIAAAEQQSTATAEAFARTEDEINSKSQDLESITSDLQRVEKQAAALDQELRQIGDQTQRAERRLSVVGAELERLRKDTERATAEKDNHQTEIDKLEAQRGQTESELKSVAEKIQKHQADAGRLAEEQVQLRTELAGLEERHKASAASLERIRQRVGEHEERREQIARQMEHWQAERKHLLEDNIELGRQVEQYTIRREQAENEISELIQTLEKSRALIGSMDEELKSLRSELEETRERRSAIELKFVEIKSDVKHLEETCTRELEKPIQEVVEEQPGEVTPEQLEEAEINYQQLKTKLENLGPVNVLALEEFTEAKQRLDFLEAQQKDLLDSINDTQKAIAEIDSVSRQKFQEAFEAINRNFQQVFRTLFGGGVAEMRLTDEENANESGVDIIGSPPGKRLQNIALLSGGEKSLTAVALLMATFSYRPSPFCVLDEVDAALDEPNLVRFSRLVREMSGQTQFILITHSKTTMETAETLYGVTMQQPGVSRLVSVRLAERNGSVEPSEAVKVRQ